MQRQFSLPRGVSERQIPIRSLGTLPLTTSSMNYLDTTVPANPAARGHPPRHMILGQPSTHPVALETRPRPFLK